MCSINFKANIISYPKVKKVEANHPVKDVEVLFAELDPKDKDDYNALRTVAHSWENGRSLAVDILDFFSADRHASKSFTSHPNRYFAILDKDKYSGRLLPDSILGLAQVSKGENSYYLDFIQTNPKHKNWVYGKSFSGIGKSLVNAILGCISKKDIKAYPINGSARAFFEKLNFKQIKNSDYMRFII